MLQLKTACECVKASSAGSAGGEVGELRLREEGTCLRGRLAVRHPTVESTADVEHALQDLLHATSCHSFLSLSSGANSCGTASGPRSRWRGGSFKSYEAFSSANSPSSRPISSVPYACSRSQRTPAERRGGHQEPPAARCGEAAAVAEPAEPSSGAGRSAVGEEAAATSPATTSGSGVWGFWVR
ncbi:MAG: hypothetical protein SGPRY_001710 [Prymnesium sp.]